MPILIARSLTLLVGSLLVASGASAAPPAMDDYARGIRIETTPGRPVVEITLPDDVYLGSTRTDLGDVRVFNAEGMPVPHAFCSAPESTRPEFTGQSLPVFELRDAVRASGTGASVEVETPAGTRVNVQEGGEDSVEIRNGRTHIIDARAVDQALRAVQFDWNSPDGASEARVRIESSEDLDRWEVVVPASSLLHATRGDMEIKRERIDLPPLRYKYLRVQRIDGGPPLGIAAVVAEAITPRQEIEPVWFTPRSLPVTEPGTLQFDSDRVAAPQFARLSMTRENSSVRVSLQSRANDKQRWNERWSGESYLVVTQTDRRESPPARFGATADRLWQMKLSAESQAYEPPLLQLGYRPVRLRFLAQGGAPYTIAFGSRRAEVSAPARCEALLADLGTLDMASLVAEGYASGAVIALGGDTAFKALPKRTPVRLMVLWGVLVAGVILLIAMALSLLKRVRPTG
jgi:hypothetical protein